MEKHVLNVIVVVQTAAINKLFFKKVLTFQWRLDENLTTLMAAQTCYVLKLKTSIIFLMSRNLLEYQTQSEM